MINIKFTRRADQITRFVITGHAFNGEVAHDVVCAGVSSLAITTVNSLETIAHFQPLVEVDEVEGGFLDCEILSDLTDKQKEIAQILLQNLENGVKSIAAEVAYSSFIKVS
ncbi:hypothetical protein Hs30E_13050 [Lactococcus hodotermopsidis]|uniref:Ribosomal processing cysteine protease Prp n=1 Tax=Pseudolactococcus hodotermopsidis TaxID=2709157 RepID=A0A6A0BE44_9LACT|nr:ribosomal-processing cysteine protease Prp [Lactococcus hodotermopsidis]GFH42754.1 hypothetical protein Hs30E_13050 [Lactococcus hodotermopsidis]